jgi:choline dehydrogenase-like flavoprotein
LDRSEDALGMNRINLNWEVSSQEKRSCVEINKIVGQQFGVQSLGRLRFEANVLDIESDQWSNFTNGGWHQMGTTRMHDDHKKGVVDANCKMHSVDNLFVAGSSCFTTSGAANPTMTLVALSLRLSNHIAKLLS